MELNYILATSTIKPPSIDIQKTTVYFRKDFVEEIDEKSRPYWTYKEATMTHEEFNKYAAEQAAVNAIEGANDSLNIAQLVSGQENGDNNQLIIMEALADLYEMIATMNA